MQGEGKRERCEIKVVREGDVKECEKQKKRRRGGGWGAVMVLSCLFQH